MAAPDEVRRIAPHAGAQAMYMASPADVAVMGGAASGGKSWVSLVEALRHVHRPLFRAVYFRRTAADLKKPKGLWDTSRQIYPLFGARSREDELAWHFPSGAWLKMNHLEHENDVYDHQGAEYSLLSLDEATHFSSKVFWYLLSRNRVPLEAGMRAYCRMTCNPDPDSFIMTEFLDPAGYIDAEGYPRPEMAGRIRWYVRDTNTEQLMWGETPEELGEKAPQLFTKLPPRRLCKSFTFVPCRIDDNPSASPEYMAQLLNMPRVDRMRLLYGNWRIREAAGEMFKEGFFTIVDDVPPSVRRVRFWDLAASRRKRSDHTAGVLLSLSADGFYCVEDVREIHLRPHGTEEVIKECAIQDGVTTEVWLEQETGAAAEFVIDQLQRHVLQGFSVSGLTVRDLGSKVERAKPASSAAEKGHVRLLKGAWNRSFISQLEGFGPGSASGFKDDQVDAFTGAFHALGASTFAIASASW